MTLTEPDVDSTCPATVQVPAAATSDEVLDTNPARQRHGGSLRGASATRWHGHPAVRDRHQLTAGERAADYMRNGMGSWGFVFSALAFLAGWITVNALVARAGSHAFDAYPFILLNLLLSCLAAMQGAILLIAAKRADQISSELAAHDYAVNRRAEKLIEENTDLTRRIRELTEVIHDRVVGPETTLGGPHWLAPVPGPRNGGTT